MQSMTNTKRCFRPVLYVLVLVVAVILGTASMIGAAAKTDTDWRLIVKSAVCVQGPDVLLGEIADPIQGLDQRTWKTLASVKLWKASERRGRPVTIDREKLHKILKYYMGDNVNKLVLPNQMTVQTGGAVVTGEELRARVVAFLTVRGRDLSDDVELKNLKLPMHYFFPNANDTLEIGLSGDIKPGHNQIKLRSVSSDGRLVSSKAGTVFINVWKAVPVAAKPLNRFERITQKNVTFRRVNLAHQPEVWDGKGGPWRMVRTLGRGQPFTLAHFEQIPLIEKGERVTLVFKSKRVQLSIKAEALGDAGMGQQVSVRNLQSNKTILATVIDTDTVMVR